MLRVDYEERIELAQSEQDSLLSVIESLSPHYLVVSDYNKGTIDGSFIQKLMKYAEDRHIQILVDCKPQHMKDFTGVFLIKPNFKEFCEVIGKQIPNEDSIVEQEAKLFVEKYQTNLVVTRGNK